MMEADKAKDPMEGLEYVTYPSMEQLLVGQAQEPEQRMGDYVVTKSQHETGRVFSSIADLGAVSGVASGTQVRTSRYRLSADRLDVSSRTKNRRYPRLEASPCIYISFRWPVNFELSWSCVDA